MMIKTGVLVFALSNSFTSITSQTNEQALDKASELVQLLQMEQTYQQTRERMLNRFRMARQNLLIKEAVDNWMEETISWKILEPMIVKHYANNFSRQELHEIITFYQSSSGTKLRKFDAKATPILEKELKARIERGLPQLQQQIGKLLVRRNGDQKETLLTKAEEGDVRAQRRLAIMYEQGKGGFEKDIAEAMRWNIKAEAQGDTDARYDLAWAYRDGHGVAIDKAKSQTLFRKLAVQGDVDAQETLANMLADGIGSERDPDGASHWYQEAMKNGSTIAKANFAFLHALCPSQRVCDAEKSIRWTQEEIANSGENARTLDNLAAGYARAQNFDKAVTTQQLAIEHAIKESSPPSRIASFNKRLQAYQNHRPWSYDEEHAMR